MNSCVYFITQIIGSIIVATPIWYLLLKNAYFGFGGTSDFALFDLILIIGSIIYIALTIAYIVLGRRKTKNWKPWIIIVSIFICVTVGFLSLFIVAYGSELLNKF